MSLNCWSIIPRIDILNSGWTPSIDDLLSTGIANVETWKIIPSKSCQMFELGGSLIQLQSFSKLQLA